ncbi:MAG TPA: efflux RND transporter periplasmic adaptor subunit [Verrucomicrobiae bacterium]|nr:efflux RND transporter periplasmic adaptor subunit [Verrucomicrobiae bacterium]
MAKSKKGRKFLIFGIITLALVALALAAVFRKKDDAISVQTDKVKRRDLTELVVANGRIQPVVQVVISPEVAGEITALPVKEGDKVKKGDLLVQIKPDSYRASRNSAEASFKSAQAGQTLAMAELERAAAEYFRNQELFKNKLVSDSVMMDFKTAYEVAKLRYTNSLHSAAQAGFALDKANDDLSKTTILAPIDGTVTRLKSQLGERVLGTSFNQGTEIMTVADLSQMEARVDIGEMDVILIEPGQRARLEVDAFKDRKFTGSVTEIANSSRGSSASAALGGGGQSQEATKFEVRIRIAEKENFRPGMSINAEIETRYRTNVLTVPIAAITTRTPKPSGPGTNSPAGNTNSLKETNAVLVVNASSGTNGPSDKKSREGMKPIEVVFVVDGDKARQVPVKIGISDAESYEVVEGLEEGQEIITGNYKAVNKELEDGKKITKSHGKFGEMEKK